MGGSNPSAGTQISGCSGKPSDKARIRVEQRLVDRALLSSTAASLFSVAVFRTYYYSVPQEQEELLLPCFLLDADLLLAPSAPMMT